MRDGEIEDNAGQTASEPATIQGGCHCGRVRFRAVADLSTVMECNCSHCSRKGLLLTFTPLANFELVEGEGETTEYRFHRHVIAHRFCKTCGVQPFATGALPDGSGVAAINAGCVDGVDIAALNREPTDGRSF
jgi:hypothetical protein